MQQAQGKLSDMDVLECLQDAFDSEKAELNSDCQQAIWDFKVRIE